MRPLPLLLLLAATASAAAPEVPPPFRGDYIPVAFSDAVLQRAPTLPPVYPVVFTLGASSVTRGSFIEVDEVKVRGVQEKGGQLRLQLEAPEEGQEEVFILNRENGTARVSDGTDRWVRVADVLPAAQGLPADVLRTSAYLSRGWWNEKDGRAWYFVPTLPSSLKSEGDPQGSVQQGPTSKTFKGGFGFHEVIMLGKELFLLEPQQDGSLRLLPTTEPTESPDYVPTPGRKPTVLKPMKEPPFVVLADKLTLRTKPSPDAPKVTLLDNLTPVALWARREGTDTLRGLRGSWLLLQAGDKVGWAFSPYVGLRQELNVTMKPGPARVGPATDSGPTYVFGLEALKPVCQVRTKKATASPKGAPTEASRVTLLLARLNDDAVLDPACLYTRAGYLTLCPLLSDKAGTAFTPAGCLDVPAEVLPPVWAKDTNGDGHLDLHLGEGQDAQVAVYDAALKAFAWKRQ